MCQRHLCLLPYLSFLAMSAVIYLIAAVWTNTELMVVVAVISVAFSIRRYQKKRKARGQKEIDAEEKRPGSVIPIRAGEEKSDGKICQSGES